MYAEFTCGRCEAHMQIDAEDHDEGVWSLIWRFTNNHTTSTCGGMFTSGSSLEEPLPEVKLVPRPSRPPDGDEAPV